MACALSRITWMRFCQAGSWAAVMDVGGAHAGTLAGAMNMLGNIGGAMCPLVIGYILKWTNSNWNLTFYLGAAVYLLGIVCWAFMDPVTPLDDAPAAGRLAAA